MGRGRERDPRSIRDQEGSPPNCSVFRLPPSAFMVVRMPKLVTTSLPPSADQEGFVSDAPGGVIVCSPVPSGLTVKILKSVLP